MIPPIGPGEKALALLVVRFKEIRMRGDVFRPELLHHRVYFLWFIVIAVRKHISELTRIELPQPGSPGYGLKVALVGLWVMPLGEISN
jgi:hypothetical protein